MRQAIKPLHELSDMNIHTKLKLSALWIAMMFLFAYGDIYGGFRPDVIESLRLGRIAGFQVDQIFLFAVSLYILIPSLMVFLSLTLKPPVNRWTNIILSVVYITTILLSCIGETWTYYIFLSVMESALLLLIAWFAWRWPEREAITPANR